MVKCQQPFLITKFTLLFSFSRVHESGSSGLLEDDIMIQPLAEWFRECMHDDKTH